MKKDERKVIRLTLDLPADKSKAVKVAAAQAGVSMKSWIEAAIDAKLESEKH